MPTKSNLKKELWKSAVKVRKRAYAPYSRFKVGAAIRDESGKIFAGCNVENSSYGATICAERSALASLISAGSLQVKEIAIVTNTPEGCPPCGICRQCLAEFAVDPKKVMVHMGNTQGLVKSISLFDLLPEAFDAHYLDP